MPEVPGRPKMAYVAVWRKSVFLCIKSLHLIRELK